jgi:hypothetical protein
MMGHSRTMAGDTVIDESVHQLSMSLQLPKPPARLVRRIGHAHKSRRRCAPARIGGMCVSNRWLRRWRAGSRLPPKPTQKSGPPWNSLKGRAQLPSGLWEVMLPAR